MSRGVSLGLGMDVEQRAPRDFSETSVVPDPSMGTCPGAKPVLTSCEPTHVGTPSSIHMHTYTMHAHTNTQKYTHALHKHACKHRRPHPLGINT